MRTSDVAFESVIVKCDAKMFSFKFVNIVIFLVLVFEAQGNTSISDKRLCADPECSQIISRAKTILGYSSPHPKILSFKPNVEVKIFSKSAGNNTDLWGAEIDDLRGYIPKRLVREYKVVIKNLAHLVDTEISEVKSPLVDNNDHKPEPDSVKNYDIVDGTTIYLNNEEKLIQPSPTESPHKATTVPYVQSAGDDKKEGLEKKDFVADAGKKEEMTEADFEDDEDDDDDDFEDEDDEDEDTEDTDERAHKIVPEEDSMFLNQNASDTNNKLTGFEGKVAEKDIKKEEVTVETTQSNETEVKSFETKNAEEAKLAATELVEETKGSEAKLAEETNTTDTKVVDETKAKEEKLVEETKPVETKLTDATTPVVTKLLDEAKLVEAKLEEKTKPVDTTSEEETKTAETKVVEETKPLEIKFDEIKGTETKSEEIKAAETKPVETKPVQSKSVDTNAEETKTAETHFNLFQSQPLGDQILEPKPTEIKRDVNLLAELSITVEHDKIVITDSSNKPEEKLKALNDTKADDEKLLEPTLEKPNENGEELKDFANSFHSILKNSYNEQQNLATELNNSPDKNVEKTDNDSNQNFEESQPVVENKIDEIKKENSDKDVNLNSGENSSKEDVEDSTPGMFSGIFNMFGGSDEVKEGAGEEIPNVESFTTETYNNDYVESPLRLETEPYKVETNTESNSVLHNQDFDNNKKQFGEQGNSNIDADVGEENKQIEPEDKSSISQPSSESVVCDSEYSPEGSCQVKSKLENFYDEFKWQTVADSVNLDFSEIYNLLLVLAITAVSVIIFLWGYIFLDKSRREAPLIAKVNSLEKSLLVAKKENQILNEKLEDNCNITSNVPELISNEYFEELKQELSEWQNKCATLEEEKQGLEKELENSTEVGLELNRMLTDILSSQNGNETFIANIEQLQRQLVEQQSTVNNLNVNMSVKETENHELQLELEICNKKVIDLQSELDKMVESILKIEDEKEQCQGKLENQIVSLQDTMRKTVSNLNEENSKLKEEAVIIASKMHDLERNFEIKCNEYIILKDSLDVLKTAKNQKEAFRKLLEVTEVKARYEQSKSENVSLIARLNKEQESKSAMQTQVENIVREMNLLKAKYEEADKHKLETQTKLEVLQNYFGEREAQLQKEISKHESMFMEKQGEATSTTERIKFMQSELQNYKSQYESLKQELVSQEVELKSQISVLEKKAHESWVSARQAERKLEDMKQEAAQLRNRLTLRERNITGDDKGPNRMQSPLDQNGDLGLSPIHMGVDSPASPPLMYGGGREHMTTSPPLPGMPPFLPPPPPPGAPFMPPPFMPPPPSAMFPGDHRPPPLGRMSSPPLNSRYSPDSRAYSPYDRNSPSPSYDDEYGSSPPPMHRTFSPFRNSHREERRDYKRPPPTSRNNVRNYKGSTNFSSGSGNSNESIEKINGRHHSKV